MTASEKNTKKPKPKPIFFLREPPPSGFNFLNLQPLFTIGFFSKNSQPLAIFFDFLSPRRPATFQSQTAALPWLEIFSSDRQPAKASSPQRADQSFFSTLPSLSVKTDPAAPPIAIFPTELRTAHAHLPPPTESLLRLLVDPSQRQLIPADPRSSSPADSQDITIPFVISSDRQQTQLTTSSNVVPRRRQRGEGSRPETVKRE